jgi:hypothetical protein
MKSLANGRSIESLSRKPVIGPFKQDKLAMRVGEKPSSVQDLGRKIRRTA